MQAMAKCPESLPTVPDDLHSLPPNVAFSTLLRTILKSQETYFTCARNHQELVRWIEDGR